MSSVFGIIFTHIRLNETLLERSKCIRLYGKGQRTKLTTHETSYVKTEFSAKYLVDSLNFDWKWQSMRIYHSYVLVFSQNWVYPFNWLRYWLYVKVFWFFLKSRINSGYFDVRILIRKKLITRYTWSCGCHETLCIR